MANGFEGLSINSKRKLSIQTPIGFFGFAVVLANAPNLFIKVLNGGKPLRNTLVTALNPTSGIPDAKTTDGDGNVGLKADAVTDITFNNGVFNESYSYVRATDGNRFEFPFFIPSLI